MQLNTIEILGRDGCSTCSSMYQTVIDIMAEKILRRTFSM